ncbi:hypothetical protein BKP45_21135 [Anaerobacillus alkalidiazotrophicus]|uniref:Uncharacterized protein n=1 Tax=Anaerobacillus alkalidiazotrophicus TaxID=472963 RepID=A0A1S2LVF1_9BACI|nr:hypothetical protein [Anaerobacillus alkalidiazotrophicus]OIJ16512.1 hypothetical protein BKP45_21135 [Anaerobacillus alkalidiazotrophicus]
MYLGSLEERRARSNEIKLVTAALYEAKVKDEEILRVLMKVCYADREEATNAFRKEKFMLYPCRELYQYMILEKGFEEHDAVFIYNKAKRALADNRELSKLSPAKLFDAINKGNK